MHRQVRHLCFRMAIVQDYPPLREAGRSHRLLFFELADQQFELLNLMVELFGGPAEACAPQHGQLHLQLFDVQRLGVDLGNPPPRAAWV